MMSKEVFRFLRGELNGFYIKGIQDTFNLIYKDVKKFFIYFSKAQLYNNTLSDSDLRGIGIFAGVFLPRIAQEEAQTNIKLTNSYLSDGFEFSERGLYNTIEERFEFKHLYPDSVDEQGNIIYNPANEVEPDINTLASSTLRSSLVGNEQPIGYLSSDEEDLIDSNNLVRPTKILNEPPENTAYSDFYGNQFLFLSENKITYSNISYDLYASLFRIIQRVRYNGSTLESLCETVNVLCPNGLVLLKNIVLTQDKTHFIIYYKYDDTVDVSYKQQRVSLLNYILRIKYPLFILEEEL